MKDNVLIVLIQFQNGKRDQMKTAKGMINTR
jgi:hypothetical protein